MKAAQRITANGIPCVNTGADIKGGEGMVEKVH